MKLRCLFDIKSNMQHLCTWLRMAPVEGPLMCTNLLLIASADAQPLQSAVFQSRPRAQMERAALLSHTSPLPPLITLSPAPVYVCFLLLIFCRLFPKCTIHPKLKFRLFSIHAAVAGGACENSYSLCPFEQEFHPLPNQWRMIVLLDSN